MWVHKIQDVTEYKMKNNIKWAHKIMAHLCKSFLFFLSVYALTANYRDLIQQEPKPFLVPHEEHLCHNLNLMRHELF